MEYSFHVTSMIVCSSYVYITFGIHCSGSIYRNAVITLNIGIFHIFHKIEKIIAERILRIKFGSSEGPQTLRQK